MKDRIKFARTTTGKTQTEFGNFFGVSKSAVQKWESGENTPVESVLKVMAQVSGVNEVWLRTGVGEPFQEKSRAEEMGELVKRLMHDDPDSFRVRLITTLLRFEPSSPQWEVLEEIYKSVAGESKDTGK